MHEHAPMGPIPPHRRMPWNLERDLDVEAAGRICGNLA